MDITEPGLNGVGIGIGLVSGKGVYVGAHQTRPSVVSAGAKLVDFLEINRAIITHFADVNAAGFIIDVHGVGIAMAVGINLAARAGHVDKRIVGGDRTVKIETEDFPAQDI